MLELSREELRVEHEERILFEELFCQRFAIAFCGYISFDFVDGKEVNPFFTLFFVCTNFSIE